MRGEYNNYADNCAKYGRLYNWAAAMDSAGIWSRNGWDCGYGRKCSPVETVRGVCPEGWHLPSQEEWNMLLTTVSGNSNAGRDLKSQSRWCCNSAGTDAFGFSALPAGYRDFDESFYREGNFAYFWSSTELDSLSAYNMYLGSDNNDAGLNNHDKGNGFSVRCVKD